MFLESFLYFMISAAITDILLRQPQGKILVGDPHQQIYSFRGAVNAMEMIEADTVFYLTQVGSDLVFGCLRFFGAA